MISAESNYWRRLQPLLNRRQVLRGTAIGAAGLAATALLGCGKELEPPTSTGPQVSEVQPKRGGFITHGQSQNGDLRELGYDPLVNSVHLSQWTGLFYQSLLGYSPRTYEVEPEIAQKWEQPSPAEYIFTLQPGVKWHNKTPVNGRDLTVDDVVYSLERARADDPRNVARSFLVSIDNVAAVDRSRIRITTKQPDASTVFKLTPDDIRIMAPEAIERFDKLGTAETAIGTGPFIVKSVEPLVAGEYVRNPDYWRAGQPYLDGVRTKYFSEDSLAYAAFLAKQLDVTTVRFEQLKEHLARLGPDYKPDWFKAPSGSQLTAGVKAPPMNDQRVYMALRYLVDHDEFIETRTQGLREASRYGFMFSAAMEPWDLAQEEYPKFLEWKRPKDEAVRVALQQLSAAGYTRDNPLRFEIRTEEQINFRSAVELVDAQWRRLGQGVVQATIRISPRAEMGRVWSSGDFAYTYAGNSGGIPDVDATLTQIYHSKGSRNFGKFADPTLDAMIDKQRTIFDIQQRKAFVREIILYCMDRLPYTTPSSELSLNGINPSIRGFAPMNELHGRQFQHMWLDT